MGTDALAIRAWLDVEAERLLRTDVHESLAEREFCLTTIRGLEVPDARKQVIDLLDSAPDRRFLVRRRNAWNPERVMALWRDELQRRIPRGLLIGRRRLAPKTIRHVIEHWTAGCRAAESWVASLPREVKLLASRLRVAMMGMLVEEIRSYARKFAEITKPSGVGTRLSPEGVRNQVWLMRLLRTHAILGAQVPDRAWRRAALDAVWTNLGFAVDAVPDVAGEVQVRPSIVRELPLDLSGLSAVTSMPELPLLDVLNALIRGVQRGESALHDYLRGPPIATPPPGTPPLLRAAGGLLIPAAAYAEWAKPHIAARFDLLAIAALSVTQLEGLIHQCAYCNGGVIGAVPKSARSLKLLTSALQSHLIKDLQEFFGKGTSSPRFRFVHGAIGDLHSHGTLETAIAATRLLERLLWDARKRQWIASAPSEWWWGARIADPGSIGFVNAMFEKHANTLAMIDHLSEVPRILDELAPNYDNVWRLCLGCVWRQETPGNSAWGVASLAIPMVEVIARNLAEVRGFQILKVGRSGTQHRFDVALLNDKELLRPEFLGEVFPDGVSSSNGRRLLALFMRTRDAFAHGEILATGMGGLDMIKLTLLVAAILTYGLRSTESAGRRGGA